MPGPIPKDPKLRQRTNRVSTAAVLTLMPSQDRQTAESILGKPDLPLRIGDDRAWHPETLDYWAKVWESPMAAEYVEADVSGLIGLFKLIDEFNYGTHALAAEIRLQRQCFGLTPLDRRRLQWEISRVEAAEKRPVRSGPRSTMDPRKALMAAK